MYNQELKMKFLSLYNNRDTQETYRRIFEKSQLTERLLDRDLKDFSRDEIEDVLYDLNPLTSMASQTNGRIITAYISWALNGTNAINPLKAVSPSWFNKFVDKNKKIYFSVNEISMIGQACENAQDEVIFWLLFEGINGKEAIEIRNLKRTDIDFGEGVLRIHTNDTHRQNFKVKYDRTIISLIEAIKQRKYTKKNGQMAEVDNVRTFTDLTENNYVVRSSITRTDSHNSCVDKSVIYRRVSTIGETLGIPYLTTKNIMRSGMIAMAKDLLERDDKLDKDQYIEICERYSVKNWYSLKEFCNIETIKKLYPEVDIPLSRHAR